MSSRRNKSLRSKWTAAEFNERYPIGTPVRYQPVAGIEEYEDTVTRSEAWELGHGAPIVKVSGRTGGVCLGHITILGKP